MEGGINDEYEDTLLAKLVMVLKYGEVKNEDEKEKSS